MAFQQERQDGRQDPGDYRTPPNHNLSADRGGKNQHKAQHEKGFIDSAKNKQKTYRYAMGFCPLGIYMVCLLPYFIVAVQFFET